MPPDPRLTSAALAVSLRPHARPRAAVDVEAELREVARRYPDPWPALAKMADTTKET